MASIPDLVVVGGGPAGLAAGIYARLFGLRAVILERGSPPIDKACGEGVMPGGVRALAEMGVRLAPPMRAELRGVRFVDGDRAATAPFRDAMGWGVRRTRLSEALVRRAQELGVELRFGCSVTSVRRERDGTMLACTSEGVVGGHVLVGADGLHSLVRRWLASADGVRSRAPAPQRQSRFGMRRHFAVRPWSPFVEVHFGRGFEAYVTPVGPEEVGVALLWSGEKVGFAELLGRLPQLQARVVGRTGNTSTSTSTLRGAGPMAQRPRSRVGDGVALIGDAAGYLDALTGEGLCLAWGTARALIECVARREPEPLHAYERRYRQMTRGYYTITAAMLLMSRHPHLRRPVLAFLAENPGVFAAAMALMEI